MLHDTNANNEDSGKAIQIIYLKNEKFCLNEDNLKEILMHPNAKDKPVN